MEKNYITLKLIAETLINIVSASNHIKCVLLSNQKCMTQPTLINLYPNECNWKLCYYPFAFNLDRSAWSWNTLDYISNRVCVPHETEDVSLHDFNMTTGRNQSITLTKHTSCKWECKLDFKKI